MTPATINKSLVVPAEDGKTPVSADEAAFIYSFIKKHGLSRTLETGFAYGRSASHIIAATSATHVVIDPFQTSFQNQGIKNIERLCLDQHLDFREDFSHSVLAELVKEKRRFDFAFIDGDHSFDGILVDFYFVDLLLEQNGYVLFHDTWMRSTQLVTSYLRNNRKNFRVVPTGIPNFALLPEG